jgi:hypothetical protein
MVLEVLVYEEEDPLLLGLAHHGNFVCVADKTVHVMVRK